MRFRLALGVSAMVGALVLPAAASAAVGDRYTDGRDRAVGSAAPGNFRLDGRNLEPDCFRIFDFPHSDVGDSNTSIHIVNLDPRRSIDQVLVPGQHTGYQVYNTFDTGGPGGPDQDIDTGQEANSLDAPKYRNSLGLTVQDDVAFGGAIVCVSDHDDAGQNEPYAHSDGGAGASDGVNNANEVYAKNRPVIQPNVATLGQVPNQNIKRYLLGMGYSVQKWYSLANASGETPLLRLTDPMGFNLDKLVTTPVLGGNSTTVAIDTAAGHVVIPPRIAGPRFDAVTDGPGVLRVNDVDMAGEQFGNPHDERANYGQTDVFNVRGDNRSDIAFTTQGDLPITWSLKASLASVDSLRSASFTPAQFDAWEQGWQNYYCGKGAHPTMPLTPGTDSPTPRDCPVIVNAPESRPSAAPTVVVNVATLGTAAPTSTKKKATAKQRAAYKRCLKKANKKHGKKSRSKARAKCARMPH
jgi:hypothetical protein